MGLGFGFMAMAANEVNYDASGNITQKSAMYWLLLAYFFIQLVNYALHL